MTKKVHVLSIVEYPSDQKIYAWIYDSVQQTLVRAEVQRGSSFEAGYPRKIEAIEIELEGTHAK